MGDPWKSISPEGVRAFSYGVYSVALMWVWAEGYLLFLNNLLISFGASVLLAKSILVSTVISILLVFILYGLHGKLPTTLMLQHMTWVKNPDKFQEYLVQTFKNYNPDFLLLDRFHRN